MTKPVSSDIQNHSMLAKIFHWGFIVVFIYAMIKQVGNVNQLSDPGLLRFEIIFGLVFLALLVGRYIYMRNTQPTALPDTAPRALRLMARAGHLAMYISLAMIAVSGLLIGAIFSLGGANGFGMSFARSFHEVSIALSLISIGVHVIAAIYHRLKGDGIWTSMVPFWKEDGS